MPSRRAVLARAACLPLLSFPIAAQAGARKVFAPGGIALGGTDPVAYFVDAAPRDGGPDHALLWRGVVWHFVSEENRGRFEMDPKGFAPRFGGYCALAVAEGRVAPSVPEAWTIHEGRLYLSRSLEARARWRADIAANIVRAESNWPAVLG